MKTERAADAVDRILDQWHRERPDLDVAPMATIGRLRRCALLLQRRLDDTFADFGMSSWEFDMLATLRRAGAPHRLTPTALFSALMITSGTMTHRLQRLEAAGWIVRLPNPDDARSMLVQLSEAGLQLVDRAVEAHVANEHRILAPLDSKQLAALDAGLARLLAVLEPGA
ncbi:MULTISPECIES: MarR family winged helix-turn-helix transcriptional regulator [Rugamonas]|uniref:DNA-binding transcriptional regulator, MarR family n=1 Tax=Rugamonas rubra TaxID=758825 RepID=A0A1I4M148_9BURK|nr:MULTISPECIES: MarR family transcriptional regulator [Rugamonas]WGG49375.1 MarR family transcriptional regulator [Rugamonas sp. DEMB1]SFL96940.1 DNA-binding transcriptional regulator, MarR family [Rugamonas rubra]